MNRDLSENPSLLKLDLYCKGIRIHDSCHTERDGGREILRTRAGLGSGLEVVLPEGYYTNVPVVEDFASQSPYELRRIDGAYVIFLDERPVTEVSLSPRPCWYDFKTTSGKSMTRVGTLQGTYLGVYPAKVCEYWTEAERTNCKFCSVGLNLGVDDANTKSVDEVLEVVIAARRGSGITYVDFNTGHYEGETYLDILEPYIRAVKEKTGLLVGVQTPPHARLERYHDLFDLGVNRVSFCFEIFDPLRFEQICPGKHREYGLSRYLQAVEYCAKLGRERATLEHPWITNGEIIAGLEPPESSIRAIDWITSVGAVPTVCVFRPVKGTDLAQEPAPRTEDMIPIFRRLYDACMEKGLPIGVAPNVHVSLVMLPEECKHLSERSYPFKRAKLSLLKSLFGRKFQKHVDRKMRLLDKGPVPARDGDGPMENPGRRISSERERLAFRTSLPNWHPIATMLDEHTLILQKLEQLEQCVQPMEPHGIEAASNVLSLARFLIDLEPHHAREEQVLFPVLRELGFDGPPSVMAHEHVVLRELAQRVHDLSGAILRGEETLWRRLRDAARDLIDTLRAHIEKEDTILYPMAVSMVHGEERWHAMRRQCDVIGYGCTVPEVPGAVVPAAR